MSRTEREKMLAGEPYRPGDPELQAGMAAAKAWMTEYNAAMAASPDERRALLRRCLGHVGEGVVIRPPFFCDYGVNIDIGNGAFLNFNCIILDVAPVTIGAGAQIGPAVQPCSSSPPIIRATRRCAVRALSLDGRCGSGRTAGSAAGRSSCPVSRSATTPSSGQAPW